MKRNGFTLIELLIAATIIGILAVFATVAYRNSASDARAASAKAYANALAQAAQRYLLDPSACYSSNVAITSTPTVGALVQCGLLETNRSADSSEYFSYTLNVSDSSCFVKMTPKTAYLGKLSDRYKKYSYCVSNAGVGTESF